MPRPQSQRNQRRQRGPRRLLPASYDAPSPAPRSPARDIEPLDISHDEEQRTLIRDDARAILALRRDALRNLNLPPHLRLQQAADYQAEAATLLHLAGYPWGLVASSCEYPSWEEAKRAVELRARQTRVFDREVRQSLLLGELARYKGFLEPQASGGSVEAINTLLAINERESAILADDEPKRNSPNVIMTGDLEKVEQMLTRLAPGGNANLQGFRALVQQAGYELPDGTQSSAAPDESEAVVVEAEVRETDETAQ